jgi:hypothetical protein
MAKVIGLNIQWLEIQAHHPYLQNSPTKPFALAKE